MVNQVVQQNRIVIVGSGFGGLNVVKSLKKAANCKITLIDKTNYHLFQPLLYQVATAALSPSDIAMPIREIFRNLPNVETLMGTVMAINKHDKTILLESGEVVPFDNLIIATGARHSYFGKNHWEVFSPGLKTLQDAVNIRERILASFELAERSHDKEGMDKYLRFIIIGGGPTGIEMAGAIAEIAHQSLNKNYRRVDPRKAQIYLLEGGTQLLAGYPASMAMRAKQDLEKMGVTVKLNSLATEITEEGVYLGNEFLVAHNIIWAAGNEASPLLKTLNVPLDKQGRVIVETDLSVPHYPDIFVIGDAACFMDQNGRALPAVAPVAVQQGVYVGKMIGKQVKKETRKPFRYVDRGMMATIGKYKALVMSGPFKCTGFLAWMAWCFIHIYFLIGYRTKFFVFAQWVFYFFWGHRNVRLIFKPLHIKPDDEEFIS
ncbi:MAG: FAD-dependent oxidoreductase [Gammaproteobacteria bacterium 39-13]|nr:NAD(P)/FAD-dependent oxidoreductase [Gammaproteobacteria bacterium]OJV91154.1 MAG: FAD-dependent oxidoreductase [Gammaproteobacteria bacterium 39-13]